MAKKSNLFSEGAMLPHCPRPGVLLYLEDWDAISKATTLEQRGLLVDVIVSYVRFGVVPDFSTDPYLRMAWGFLSPKLDRDQEDYDIGTWTRRYNAYKRNEKDPLEADQWLRAVTGRDGSLQYEYETESVSASEYESANGHESANEKVSASVSASGAGAGKGDGKGNAGEGEGKPLSWTETDFEREKLKKMQMVARYQ